MLPNQTPVKFGTYQAPLCHTLYTAPIEVGCASRPRDIDMFVIKLLSLKHCTGLLRGREKGSSLLHPYPLSISIQVLYGRLTKVSRIIFQLVMAFLLYLCQITNLHSLFADHYTLRV
jgi:hypothetical protein